MEPALLPVPFFLLRLFHFNLVGAQWCNALLFACLQVTFPSRAPLGTCQTDSYSQTNDFLTRTNCLSCAASACFVTKRWPGPSQLVLRVAAT